MTNSISSFAFVLMVSVAVAKEEVYAPVEAFLEGEQQPYYGSVDDWNLRFFTDHIKETYGRRGQRQMLDIQQGKSHETILYCQQLIEEDPKDLESLFTLTVAYCNLKQTEKAWQSAKLAIEAGLPIERFLAGPREILKPLYHHEDFQKLAKQQNIKLLHGPMLGAVTNVGARVWLRTAKPSQVEVKVFTASNPKKLISKGMQNTTAATDHTAVVELTGLSPASKYRYEVYIDGEKISGDKENLLRTYPSSGQAAKFQIGFGGGALYTPAKERMWTEIASRQLAGFFLLGDNIYIDLPEQVSPMHRYSYYRRQSRPEFRHLIARTPIYAIWDDHDCATDDCFMGPYRDRPTWKPSLFQLFRENWNNPTYGAEPDWPGCWFKLQIADVDFFFLDGRYYRTNPLVKNASMLGPVQKQWLFDELKKSQATFKLIISPVCFTDKAKSALDTWRGYPQERAEIFQFLTDQKIAGVVLIAADRHRSDAWLHERTGDYPLYEFHSSCLTHSEHSFSDLQPGSLVGYNKKCSYGLLTFDTDKNDPELLYEIVNIDGESVEQIPLKRSQLVENR